MRTTDYIEFRFIYFLISEKKLILYQVIELIFDWVLFTDGNYFKVLKEPKKNKKNYIE